MESMSFLTGPRHMNDLIAVKFIQYQLDVSCELPPLTLRLEVGASCFIDPGYYHTTWQFSHDLHKRYGSASSSPTVIICDLCRQ